MGWLKSKVPVHSEPRNQIGFLACPSGEEDVRRQHRQQTQWPDTGLELETIHRFHNRFSQLREGPDVLQPGEGPL